MRFDSSYNIFVALLITLLTEGAASLPSKSRNRKNLFDDDRDKGESNDYQNNANLISAKICTNISASEVWDDDDWSGSWHLGQRGESCIRLSRTAHTFEDCQEKVCGPAGGTLACIHSKKDLPDFQFGSTREWYEYWVGFSDAGYPDDWQWIQQVSNKLVVHLDLVLCILSVST